MKFRISSLSVILVLWIVGMALILRGQSPKPPANDQKIIGATVERATRIEQREVTEIKITCPAGYEGHFVDREVGFQSTQSFGLTPSYAFVICFDTKFIDDVRKNPALTQPRPTVQFSSTGNLPVMWSTYLKEVK